MIMEQLTSEVADRLNLTSDESKSRIGRNINSRYKRITSSIGLDTSRRTSVSKAATIGNRLITFTGIEKILAVIDKTDPAQDIVLEQITPDEMHLTPLRGSPPRHYAIYTMDPISVTIQVDCIPVSPVFTLYADGISTVTTLAGNQQPDFPESFHDILIFGAMADEYRKMEKIPLYKDAEADFERRLSDLRMFIAKSSYLDITQGRYEGRAFRWTRDSQLLWSQ